MSPKKSKKQPLKRSAKASRGGKREKEIDRLRRELERERRRSAKLAREVAALRRELDEQATVDKDPAIRQLRRLRHPPSEEERLLTAAARRAGQHRQETFLLFVWNSIMESPLMGILAKLVNYLRRVQVIRMASTIVLALLAVVAVSFVSAAILPFLLIGTAGLGGMAYLRSHRMNKRLKKVLEGKHIRILIPPRRAALAENSFFIRNARAMAAEPDTAVIVVSPYLISHRGAGGKGPYFTARRDGSDLYLVRRHYYFILRRQILDGIDRGLCVMY